MLVCHGRPQQGAMEMPEKKGATRTWTGGLRGNSDGCDHLSSTVTMDSMDHVCFRGFLETFTLMFFVPKLHLSMPDGRFDTLGDALAFSSFF